VGFSIKEKAPEKKKSVFLYFYFSGLFLLVYSLAGEKTTRLFVALHGIQHLSFPLCIYRETHREMPTPLMEQSSSINIVVDSLIL
jgi:hypothetical protein